jgi:hypothetical protein
MKHLPPSRWLLTVCFVTIGAFRAIGETSKKPDLPPQEVIDAVFSQGPSPPVQVLVEKPAGSKPDLLCRLTPADLHVTRGDEARTYKMLVEAPDRKPLNPTKVFLRVSRFTVDADGSSRAYHPDDPLGIGVCEPGKSSVCALDELPNADVGLFKGTKQVEHDTAEDRADYLTTWAKAWSLRKCRY